MSVQRQNPDGTWSDAEPTGWQGPENQVDWEVYWKGAGWVAYGYNRATPVGKIVSARTRLGLVLRARWSVGFRTPVTFLWDSKRSDR